MEATQQTAIPGNPSETHETSDEGERGSRRSCGPRGCGPRGCGPRRRGMGFVVFIALLAALAGGFIGKSFAHGPFGGGFGGPMAFGAMGDPARLDSQVERMVRHFALEVDATPEQRDRLTAIAKSAARDLQPLHQRIADARKQAATLAAAPGIDRAALEKLRGEQVTLIDNASKRVTQALADAGEVLTPAQRQKIAERMKARQQRHGGFQRG